MRNITINPALNGYIVTVGCSQVVFNSRELLARELLRYLAKPKDVEREYIQNALNPRNDGLVNVPYDPTPIASRPSELETNLAAAQAECCRPEGMVR